MWERHLIPETRAQRYQSDEARRHANQPRSVRPQVLLAYGELVDRPQFVDSDS
jgi:hypothetical protein